MKCVAKKVNGIPCRANARAGRKWCMAHDPNRSEFLNISRKGGLNTTARLPGDLLPAIDFVNNKNALAEVLADTINRVRVIRADGTMAKEVANCVGFLVSKFVELRKNTEFEERLAEIEKRLNES